MKYAGVLSGVLILASCDSAPPKPKTPPLTPEMAQQLLNFDERAQRWLEHAHKQDPTCLYQLTLPEQQPPVTQIDLDHILSCSSRPAPLELNASVTFVYDAETGKWKLKRFSS